MEAVGITASFGHLANLGMKISAKLFFLAEPVRNVEYTKGKVKHRYLFDS